MLAYKYLIIPFMTAVTCQVIKVLLEYIRTKRLNINRFFDGMGGMPSTHSALVSSITTIVYITYGNNSILFAITLFFSLIVIYDSMGIRYESGEQAKVLNKLSNTNLKEMLGHKPIECLIGVLFGILFSIIFNFIICIG